MNIATAFGGAPECVSDGVEISLTVCTTHEEGKIFCVGTAVHAVNKFPWDCCVGFVTPVLVA